MKTYNYVCIYSAQDFQKVYPWTGELFIESDLLSIGDIGDIKEVLSKYPQVSKITFDSPNCLCAFELRNIIYVHVKSIDLNKQTITKMIQMNHIESLHMQSLESSSTTFSYLFPRLHLLTNLRSLSICDQTYISNDLLMTLINFLKKGQITSLNLAFIFDLQIEMILESLSQTKLISLELFGYTLNSLALSYLQIIIDNELSRLALDVDGDLHQLDFRKSKLVDFVNINILKSGDVSSLLQQIDQISMLAINFRMNRISVLSKNIRDLALNFGKQLIDQNLLFPLIENKTIKKLELHFYSPCQNFVKQLISKNQSLKYLQLFIRDHQYSDFDITKEVSQNKNLKYFSTIDVKIDIKQLFRFNQTLQILRYNKLSDFNDESLKSLAQNTTLIDIYQSYKVVYMKKVTKILSRNQRFKLFRKTKLSDLCRKVLNEK